MIRKTQPHEAEKLKKIALLSKASWGYSTEFMHACETYFELTPKILETSISNVVETHHIEGFYSVIPQEQGQCFLDYFFVSREDQGKGIGNQMWNHMIETLQSLNFQILDIEADQHAVAFYEKKGAIEYERKPSSIDPNYDVVMLQYKL